MDMSADMTAGRNMETTAEKIADRNIQLIADRALYSKAGRQGH